MNEETLFHQALKKPPAERAVFLENACGDNAALRSRLEAILHAHDNPGSFLQSPAPALAATVDQPIAEGPGTIIGPYKLMEQIGEGGMGLVFVAEQQQPIRRKLALKVIKPGMDTRAVIARFEAERQALALMDHPNIAKVLDGGQTASGRPYFVMELVKGVPITDYCDQQQLATRQRLELFLSVCHAIQHAHQKGIIHRDIKPSNVLVMSHDGQPVVRVIDFGVAKAIGQQLTDKTIYTQFTQLIGTPLYMSPEQAGQSSLDVDTRSDIYSLGVLLYELLTGTTPFDKQRLCTAAYDEIRRIIREEEPPKPSTRLSTLGQAAATVSANRQSDPKRLSRLFRGELDWIVMKCIEKDRNRRYETANSLALDLRRYLNEEPVQACPPSVGYRFRKFVRRNRAAMVAAVATVAMLFTTVIGLTISNMRIAREKAAAEANFRRACQAVDDQFTMISQSKLFDAPGLQYLRRELLETALKYYEDFLRQRPDDPVLQTEVAAGYFRLYEIYINLDGDMSADALLAFEKGIVIVEKLLRDYAPDDILYRRLAGFAKGGRVVHVVYSGRGPRADPLVAISLLERGARIWEDFVRDNPTVAGFQMDLSELLYCACEEHAAAGQRAEALASARKALVLRQQAARANPLPEYRAEMAHTHDLVAWRLGTVGPPEEVEGHYRQALAVRKELVEECPDVPEYREVLALSHHYLASWLADHGRYSEAEEYGVRASTMQERLVSEFPNMPHFRGTLAQYQDGLGRVLQSMSRAEKAEEAYRQALANWEKLAAAFPAITGYRARVADGSYNLSLFLAALGRPREAEPFYRRVVEFKPESPQQQNRLAWMLIAHPDPRFRDPARALELANKAIERLPNDGGVWNTVGVAHYRAGHWKDAVAALEKSMALLGGELESFNTFFLAMAHWQLGDKEPARQWYGQAIQWMEKNQPKDDELRRFRSEAAEFLGAKDQPAADKEDKTGAMVSGGISP